MSALIGDESKIRRQQYPDASTLYESFRRGAKVSNDGECLGWKPSAEEPYRWMRYGEVIRRSEFVARGFVSKGLALGQNTFVGIYSQNRPEVSLFYFFFSDWARKRGFLFQWIITEQACYVYNMVLVPLYDTLGVDAVPFVINQGKLFISFYENALYFSF